MSALHKNILKAGLPPKRPSAMFSSGGRVSRQKPDYTPIAYSKYFDSCQDVETEEGIFRVYQKGNFGPMLVLLHGGGFSALTWSLFAASVTSMVDCQVLAIDLRGHGDSHTEDEEDLSATTLASDVGAVLSSLLEKETEPHPAIILVGHSMGGAVAVRAAADELIPTLVGLAVIDVVEGSAMDALASMQSFLRGRPRGFKSLENAIEWSVRTGQIRNIESAKVSVPGQIKNVLTGKLGTVEVVQASEKAKDDSLSGATSNSTDNSLSPVNDATSPVSNHSRVSLETISDSIDEEGDSPVGDNNHKEVFKSPSFVPATVSDLTRISLEKTCALREVLSATSEQRVAYGLMSMSMPLSKKDSTAGPTH